LAQPQNKDMQRTLRITLSANQKILQRVRETYETLKSVYDTRRVKLEDLKERSLGCCLGFLNSDVQQKKLAEKIVDTVLSYRKMIATWKFFEITDNFLQNWEALIAQYVQPQQELLDENAVNYWKNTLDTDVVTTQTFVSQYTAYLEQKTCSLCFTRTSTDDLYTERRLCGFHYYGNVLKSRVAQCLALAGKDKAVLKTQKELEQLDKSLIRKKKIEPGVISKLLALVDSIESGGSSSSSSNKGPKKASAEDSESSSTGSPKESSAAAAVQQQQQQQQMESDEEEEEEEEEKEEEQEEEEDEDEDDSGSSSGDEEEEEIVEEKHKRVVVHHKKRERESKEEEKEEEKKLKKIAWVLDNYGSHLPEDVGNLLRLAYDSTDSAFETTTAFGGSVGAGVNLGNAEDPRFAVLAVTPMDGSVFLESVHNTFAEAQAARRPDSGYFKRSVMMIPKPQKKLI
jgi:hypothetical protein